MKDKIDRPHDLMGLSDVLFDELLEVLNSAATDQLRTQGVELLWATLKQSIADYGIAGHRKGRGPQLPSSRVKVTLERYRRLLWTYRRYLEEDELDQLDAQLLGVLRDLVPKLGATEPVSGLALSGGGIRSAAFGLGVLERLGELNLLSKFHFLSGVSGGGFIAGWLTAWAYRDRDALAGVEHALKAGSNGGMDPQPVRWLRLYAAYLAPRFGVFTVDVWALIAGYLLNLAINLLVLIPMLAGVLAFPLALEVLLSSAGPLTPLDPQNGHFQWLRFGVGATIFAVAFIILKRITMIRAGVGDKGIAHRVPFILALGLLAVSVPLAILFAPGFSTPDLLKGAQWSFRQFVYRSPLLPAPSVWYDYFYFGDCVSLALCCVYFFSAVGKLHEEKRHLSSTRFREIFRLPPAFAPIAFILGAISTWYAALLWPVFLMRHGNAKDILILITFGPIGVLSVLGIGEAVVVALSGRNLSDQDRASWYRGAGEAMRAVVCWLCLSGGSLWLPSIEHYIENVTRGFAPAISGATFILAFLVISVRKSRLSSNYTWPALFLCLTVCFIVAIGTSIRYSFGEISPEVAHLLDGNGSVPASPLDAAYALICCFGLVVGGVVLGSILDVNTFSLHALYRDALMRTFLGASRASSSNQTVARFAGVELLEEPQFKPRNENSITDVDNDDSPLLRWLRPKRRNGSRSFPLLILNGCLNVTGLRGHRGAAPRAQSFTFSPLHVGNPEIGYAPTDTYLTSSERKGLSLAGAMAVSGAAISTRSGDKSSRLESFILTLISARLGRWFAHPRESELRSKDGPADPHLTLAQEIISNRRRQNDWLHISDGGHYDNTGVLELLRRRCTFIVAIDASADPKLQLADIAKLIHLARVDLGARLKLVGEWKIGKEVGDVSCAFFTVKYAGAPLQGQLLYIKPVVRKDDALLPIDVKHYSLVNEDFPHERTSNQFFNASQLEAYRSLGSYTIEELSVGEEASIDDLFTNAAERLSGGAMLGAGEVEIAESWSDSSAIP